MPLCANGRDELTPNVRKKYDKARACVAALNVALKRKAEEAEMEEEVYALDQPNQDAVNKNLDYSGQKCFPRSQQRHWS